MYVSTKYVGVAMGKVKFPPPPYPQKYGWCGRDLVSCIVPK